MRSAVAVDLLNKKIAVRHLKTVYQIIVASENLMEEAMLAEKADSNFGEEYRKYLKKHREEESGHAKWLAEDIDVNGILSAAAIAMVGTQYYLVKHVDAAALLGYMFVLEGYAPDIETVCQLEAAHGKSMYRTYRHHALHDDAHTADLAAIINQAPDNLQRIIFDSAVQTAAYVVEISHELRDYHGND